MSGRGAEVAAVTALAVILTAVIAAPVLRAPSERIFGTEIVGRHHDPFTVMEQFSRPIILGVYSQPLTDVPGALLARMSGPVAAYNWIILLTFPLSAAAGFMLARYLGLSPGGAAVASLAFAFSPFHLAQAAYHPHIAQTQWIPLFLLALWRCLDRAGPAAVALLALSVAGVTLSNFYGGLIAAVITPVAVAAYWFFKSGSGPRPFARLAITAGSLALLAGGGLAYGWHAAHAGAVRGAGIAFARADLFLFSAKWWGYLVPPVEHPLLGGSAARLWSAAGVPRASLLEQQVSLGCGVVVLAMTAVVAWLVRDRRTPALAVVPVLAIVAFFALVCSLSPERTIGPVTFTRPSAWLYPIAPMFRSYARFGVVVQLMAALLAAIGAERLWRSRLAAVRYIGVALLVLAAAEYAVWPPQLWRDVLPTAAHRWAATQPDPIRVLDCAPLTPESQSVQWLTGYRILLHTPSFDDCTQPNLAEKLSAAGYTHVLVRRRTPEGRRFVSLGTPDGFKAVARFRDGEVFAVATRAPAVYTAGMTAFYAREFDAAWSWRWMGNSASWTVVNRSGRAVIARLDVEMTAFHGARRLMLRLDGREVQALLIQDGRRVIRIAPFPLAPGEHTLEFQAVDPPEVADDLVKNGDPRPLSFCVGAWRWSVEGGNP